MEKYSAHLEVLVAERTSDLQNEKLKTDLLLYSECLHVILSDLFGINIRQSLLQLVDSQDSPRVGQERKQYRRCHKANIISGI